MSMQFDGSSLTSSTHYKVTNVLLQSGNPGWDNRYSIGTENSCSLQVQIRIKGGFCRTDQIRVGCTIYIDMKMTG